jgi:galactofuranose transport system substrate-binding protein
MLKKVVVLAMSVVVLCSLIVGCGSTEESKDNSKKEVDTKKVEKELIKVGFAQVGAESDWRVANTDSMKKALTEENGFELTFVDSQQKQENEIAAIRKFIVDKVDVIVLAPTTESGWEEVLTEAKEAKIPVILVDRMIKVEDDSLYTCWLGSDFEQEGIDAANWLVKYCTDTNKTNQNIVVLQGTLGSSAELGRTSGFESIIGNNDNFTILDQQTGDFTEAKGYEVTKKILAEQSNVNVVVAQNDNMAFGAIKALEEAGMKPGKEVTIVSFDAIKKAFIAMIDGKMNVTVECNPLHGPKIAEIINKIMAGETVEKLQYIKEGVYGADTAEANIDSRTY